MENTNSIDMPSKSNLTLSGRTALNLTGVKKVKSTEPACVIAQLDNCVIVINGLNLTVQNVSISSGILDITGLVTNIKYTNSASKKFSFKNIFK
jgi:hypothetical protein